MSLTKVTKLFCGKSSDYANDKNIVCDTWSQFRTRYDVCFCKENLCNGSTEYARQSSLSMLLFTLTTIVLGAPIGDL